MRIAEARYQDAGGALEQLRNATASARILVVGDLMLDEFVFGSVRRISPEAPVPVVEITGRRFAAGGAANVASNVAALQASVLLAGVTGVDEPASRLRQLLDGISLDSSCILSDGGRPTSCKTRIIASGQQIVRIDGESREALSESVQARLIAVAGLALSDVAACIISDYGKGVVSADLVAALVAQAAQRSIPVLVDPKGHDYSKYAGVTLITPNLKEAELAAAQPINTDDDMLHAAGRIMQTAKCPSLLITQGAAGMTLFRSGHDPLHSPALAHQVFDVTGAGDTVVAMLAVAMAHGLPVDDAMLLANVAAGIVVAKPGTATVTLDELSELMRNGYPRRSLP